LIAGIAGPRQSRSYGHRHADAPDTPLSHRPRLPTVA